MSKLKNVIDYLIENRKISVNICDLAGIIKNLPELYLPWELQINSTVFCNTAKSSRIGLNSCIRCKTESVNRCRENPIPHKRSCYLGITQYVYPVVWDKTTVCIIYISNIAENDIKICRKIYMESEKNTGVSADLLENALSTCHTEQDTDKFYIVAEIINDVIISELKKEKFKAGTHNAVISEIINYCNEFYSYNLTLDYFADKHYMNSDYLCKLFRKETGETFTSFLNGVRIDKAKRMLEETDKKITEIAFEAGFSGDAYFIKKFREKCGITPKQYQKKLNFNCIIL